MATLLEILEKSTSFLEQKGVPNARFDAECLLAFELGMERMALYLNFDRPLQDIEIANLRKLVVKRSQRIPLQHLIGSVGFRNIELKSDARALIPRPDTEEIIDHALLLLKDIESPKVLEIGTGTGAIILSLQDELEKGQLVASDISREALTLAYENAKSLGVEKNIQWVHSDLFAKINGKFDLIISNPPYIPASAMAGLEPEVREHDPINALVGGGAEGLEIIDRILAEAEAFLNPGGSLLMEHGYDQGKLLAGRAALGLDFAKTFKDLSGNDRFSLWQKAKEAGQ